VSTAIDPAEPTPVPREKFRITRTTRYEDLPEFLTVKEVAVLLGRCEWTVYEGIKRGHIPSQLVGPKLKYVHRDFFRPNAEHAAPTTPAPAPPPAKTPRRGFGHRTREQKVLNLAKDLLAEALR
jgi:hypothetical protein